MSDKMIPLTVSIRELVAQSVPEHRRQFVRIVSMTEIVPTVKEEDSPPGFVPDDESEDLPVC